MSFKQFALYKWFTTVILISALPLNSLGSPACQELFGQPDTVRIDRFIDNREATPASFQSSNREYGEIAQFAEQKKNLRDLQMAARSQGFAVDDARTVVYPLMGTDLLTPLQLFPNARTIIAIDRNPLFNEEAWKSKSALVHSAVNGAWRRGTVIEREGQTGPRILGEIFSLSPRAKILSIELRRGPYSRSTGEMMISGTIRFDLGDEVGVRELIYVAAFLPVPLNSLKVNLTATLGDLKVDALIAKASLGMLESQRDSISSILNKSHGLLVEGLSNDVSLKTDTTFFPEVSMPFRSSETEPLLYPGARSQAIHGFGFGYNRVGALVTKFL